MRVAPGAPAAANVAKPHCPLKHRLNSYLEAGKVRITVRSMLNRSGNGATLGPPGRSGSGYSHWLP